MSLPVRRRTITVITKMGRAKNEALPILARLCSHYCLPAPSKYYSLRLRVGFTPNQPRIGLGLLPLNVYERIVAYPLAGWKS